VHQASNAIVPAANQAKSLSSITFNTSSEPIMKIRPVFASNWLQSYLNMLGTDFTVSGQLNPRGPSTSVWFPNMVFLTYLTYRAKKKEFAVKPVKPAQQFMIYLGLKMHGGPLSARRSVVLCFWSEYPRHRCLHNERGTHWLTRRMRAIGSNGRRWS
jgi:hypothetical protein